MCLLIHIILIIKLAIHCSKLVDFITDEGATVFYKLKVFVDVERFILVPIFLSQLSIFVRLWIGSSDIPGRDVVVVASAPDCERLAVGFSLRSNLVWIRSLQMHLAKLLALRVQLTRGRRVLQPQNVLVVVCSVAHSVLFLVPLAR